jgi:hypothetical protein
VTEALSLTPSETQEIATEYEGSNKRRKIELAGWFLASKHDVASYDLAVHLEWLLEKIAGKEGVILALTEQGWKGDVSCLWDSAFGHGGPTFSPEVLRRLSGLGLEVWFDIYFHGAYQLLEKEKKIWGGR